MKLKETVIGLAAAAAITLGLAGNASAETTSATLAENGAGVCSAAVAGGSINFGTYTWNGTAYTAPGTTPSFVVDITQNVAPETTCDVQVLGSNLTSGSSTIPVGSVTLTPLGLGSQTAFALSTTNQNLYLDTTGSRTVNATISTAALTLLPTGTYTGTLTFTASEAP